MFSLNFEFNEASIMNEYHSTPSEYISPLAFLFQKGRDQGYLTFDEILAAIPRPEQDVDQLDRLYAALLAGGIPFGDENEIQRRGRDSNPR